MALRLSARLALAAASLALSWQAAPAQAPQGLDKLSHILVLYLENRSFNNLFGEFPGAYGIANAGEAATQRDRDGKPYDKLPTAERPFDVGGNSPVVKEIPRLDGLDNKPFKIPGVRQWVGPNTLTKDPIHRFYTNRTQINGGKNDLFAAYSDVAGLVMGYYDASVMKDSNLWRLAQRHTLLDNFFMGAFGGSFLNHQWLVCACAPVWTNPPEKERSKVDPDGRVHVDGRVPVDRRVTTVADGDYAVNTTQSVFLNDGKQSQLLESQTAPTIGDKLSEKGVHWAWYSGGWTLANKSERNRQEEEQFEREKFQWHHQPLAYYERFSPLTPSGRTERDKHLLDASRLADDIRSGDLPPVAFYKPVGILNQHPEYANLTAADEEVGIIAKLMEESPMRDSYAIVITYDENGGFWDHVRPPGGDAAGARADRFGPGSRIPTIVVSPFARRGKVDHTEYETTSILKFIGERHRLNPLPSPRYGAVTSLARAFDFGP